MSDVAIKVENVSKTFKLPHEKTGSVKSAFVGLFNGNRTYEQQEVLKDISFNINKGEFFGIVGRNGSGKSTLLKLLAGIYSPDSGEIQINGKLTPFIELGVGFSPELTGRENVFLNGALLGFDRKEMLAMYEEIVEFAELEKFMDQKLKNYSSGMQVRLAFSIAIRAQSEILLLDEVLAVGDEAFQRKCYEYFSQLKKSKQTVIIVTHDMGAVQKYCTKALMLSNSKLIAIGKPRDIALKYEAENAAVSSSAPAAVNGRPAHAGISIVAVDFADGTIDKTLKKGESINLLVTIDVKKPQPFQLNLYIVNDNGTYIAGKNTVKDLPKLDLKAGKHTLRCRIESGLIASGIYAINVAAFTLEDRPLLLDAYDVAYGNAAPKFKITDRELDKDGIFYMDATWSI